MTTPPGPAPNLAGAPSVTVRLPSLLRPFVGTESEFVVRATDVPGAFREIAARRPQLRAQLFAEDGALREHVLCLHNGASTRWPGHGEAALRDGDVLDFLQAVSGG